MSKRKAPWPAVIDWLDHADLPAEGAWVQLEQIKLEPAICRTIAFVVAESEESYGVAHTADEIECSPPSLILKSAVIGIAPLELPPLPR